MKKKFYFVLVILLALVLLFSPYLLVLDHVKYGPIVLIIWILSIAYFLFLRKRIDQRFNLNSKNSESPEDEKEI